VSRRAPAIEGAIGSRTELIAITHVPAQGRFIN